MTLTGHLPPSHPLSGRAAMRGLPAAVGKLVGYEPLSLWEADTRALPGPLQAYRRQVRDFALRELRPRALEHDVAPHDAQKDREVLIAAGRAGYLSDLLPQPFGSLPWSLARFPLPWVVSLKIEEFSAACAGLALMLGAHVLGTIPLVLSGDMGLLRRFVLPAYRSSQAGAPSLFAFAITEPHAGSDVEEGTGAAVCRPGTVARRVEGGWLLNGRKVFISGGDLARAVVVFAALEGEGLESWTAFVVEKGMAGFSVVRNELKMGQRASGASELLLENVRVPDSHRVGGPRKGWTLNRATLNQSRIPVGAIALGIARGAMEAALEFAGRTRLGGRRLLDFQDVQLQLARMQTDCAAMRAMVWQSARAWNPSQAAASMTKLFCTDTSLRVCERAMELMSEQGTLHRNRAEKHFRDARLTQIYEGTNQINQLSIIEDQLEQLA